MIRRATREASRATRASRSSGTIEKEPETMAKTASNEKTMILFTSEKGGSGKSFAACAVVDYLRASGQEVAAYDSDGAVGALSTMHATKAEDGFPADHQDPTKGVVIYNVREDESRPELVNSLAHGYSLVLHDMAGGGLADLMRIQDNSEGIKRLLRAIRSAGYRVVFVHLLNTTSAATASIGTYLDVIEEAGEAAGIVSHIALLNRKFGKRDESFKYWRGAQINGTTRGGATRERFLAAGGIETELPVLDDATNAEIDWRGLTFKDAEVNPAFTLSQQQHVLNFRMDVAEALKVAKPLLGIK